MDSAIYGVIAAVYAGLLVHGFRLWRRDHAKGPRYLLFVVTAALIWDNGLMAAGYLIGEGETLKRLSFSRFWLHALVTPLLAVISWDLLRTAGVRWARHSASLWGAWSFTAALIFLELWTEVMPLRITPVHEYGALRYTSAEEPSGPPIMVMLILIPLLAAGIGLWKRKVTPLLFWGTLVMLAGSAIPLPIESSAATNLFELLLIASLWKSIRRLVTLQTQPGRKLF